MMTCCERKYSVLPVTPPHLCPGLIHRPILWGFEPVSAFSFCKYCSKALPSSRDATAAVPPPSSRSTKSWAPMDPRPPTKNASCSFTILPLASTCLCTHPKNENVASSAGQSFISFGGSTMRASRVSGSYSYVGR
eukprot:3925570-Rhodomonas_salina.1